jgi:hypothetical protein
LTKGFDKKSETGLNVDAGSKSDDEFEKLLQESARVAAEFDAAEMHCAE